MAKIGNPIANKATEAMQQGVEVVTEQADKTTAPRRMKPTVPPYAVKPALPAKKDPNTGENVLTHQEPIIYLTDKNAPLSPGTERLNPYIMRGRHHEFQRLAEIVNTPQPRHIHIITAPPGYGKSTMLEALKTYAQKIGFITVQIKAEQLTQKDSLIEHIRGTVLGQQFAPSQNQISSSATTGASVSAGIDAKFINAGVDLDHHRQQSQTHARKSSQLLLTGLQEIIQQLQQHAPHVRGVLLLCDEFQTITDYTRGNTEARNNARQNLYTLNKEFHKGNDILPITTLIAGLPNAEDAFEEVLTRPPSEHVTQLLPVDGYPVPDPNSTHCAQIIQDFVLAGQASHGHHLQIHPKDLYTWGQKCAGHVLYAHQVGAIVQENLHQWHRQGKTTVQPADIAELSYILEDKRKRYYKNRLRAIHKNQNENLGPLLTDDEQVIAVNIMHHLIIALADRQKANEHEKNPQFITWETLRHLADQCHPKPKTVTKCLQRLQAVGIIREMPFGSVFLSYKPGPSPTTPKPDPETEPWLSPTPEDAADCTIPSLITHILQRQPNVKQFTAQLRAENQQAIESCPHYRTTRWAWTDTPQTPMIPEYPAFPYHTPQTPAVITPAEAAQRATEIQQVIDQLNAQEAHTGYTPDWPDHMPQIPNHPSSQTEKYITSLSSGIKR